MNDIIFRIANYLNNFSRVSKVAILVVLVLGFFGLLLQVLYPDRPPVVSGIIPEYEFGIPENSNFTVSFTRILEEPIQKHITFKVEPPISATTYWLENNYQYYMQLEENLRLDTEYKVIVLYKNKEIFSKTFLTTAFTFEEVQEQIREQSKADLEFNQAMENLRKDFPWYDDIPIDNSQFTIVYDFDLREFRIRLKTSKNTSPEIIQNLTNTALDAMRDINIDPNEWGYHVLFID